MSPSIVRCISECFVKPQHVSEESKQPFYLTTWDLSMLSVHYIQRGLLYAKPPPDDCPKDLIKNILDRLKKSLSLTLVHCYPLAVSDLLSPIYVPLIVQSFFDHDRAINHDGHTSPLLSIQVTELVDGVFIGCSMNHAIGDGTSFWHFFNTLSEIFQAQGANIKISRPPVLKRVHFKTQSKGQFRIQHQPISSFQFLSAFVWRSITKARRFPSDQVTVCRFAINNRSRLEPPLSPDYFGNSVQTTRAVTTAGELLEQNLGWAAWQLHQAVVNHADKSVRGFVDHWLNLPFIYQIGQLFDPQSVMMGSSPRFNKYGNEFGLGKALTLRSGYAHKFDGKVSSYPGREGGGSTDLEICLPALSMNALESDVEFMTAVFFLGLKLKF
ncbi:hypothetical protein CRYUN_Cryun30bG0036800 [Craigia yunnanensis]